MSVVEKLKEHQKKEYREADHWYNLPSIRKLSRDRHRKGNQNSRSDREQLPRDGRNLIHTNPLAFLVGAVFNRGVHWKKAWEIPCCINQKGKLDASKLAKMKKSELVRLLKSLRVKPRYVDQGAETLEDVATLVERDFAGDTAAIWRDASPASVEKRLQRIRYVGPGIASMVTRILHDDCGMFRGQEQEIDIKPDVRVRRVFERTGLTNSKSENEARNAAWRLNPDFPGELDWPAFDIGGEWCVASNPRCPSCPLTAVCPKHL
ncbi:MAG: hypothetical protein OXC18_18840 [Desulfurellaceae bacterium]|nr:hypothetical protein [Desulfurellaceae bacterium]